MTWESFICNMIGDACHVSLLPFMLAAIVGLSVLVLFLRILLIEDPKEEQTSFTIGDKFESKT